MEVRIEQSWKSRLTDLFEHQKFASLADFVKTEYVNNKCYPRGKDIFRAFELTSFDETKVVILGQDPYHGPRQAHGLCFSVPDGVGHPPSLANIFKELENDVGKPLPKSGDLSSWAKQGVLLLNATLTVRERMPRSHQGKGWEWFTNMVISRISKQKGGVVFLLWGSYARDKHYLIDQSKHKVFTCGHPSPLSANKGYWFGNRHFSKTNQYLISKHKRPIDW